MSTETDFTAVQQLIALKKYETPGDEYFDGFVDQFHRKLRQDELMGNQKEGFIDQVKSFFEEISLAKAVIMGGCAYAAVAIMMTGFANHGGVADSHPIPEVLNDSPVRAVNYEQESPVNFSPHHIYERVVEDEVIFDGQRQEF